MCLYEKIRPRTLEGVIGQPDAVRRLSTMAKAGKLAGNAYWFAGSSGTGKTTLSRIVAHLVTADCELAEVEMDCGELTPKAVTEFERSCRCRPIGGNGWAFIVNEAHGLRRDTVRQLLVTLERIPSHVVWCFTTTNAGQQALFDGCEDSHPLLSRCCYFGLETRLEKLLPLQVQYLARVAMEHGFADDIDPEKLVEIVQRSKGNVREQLQFLASGGLAS